MTHPSCGATTTSPSNAYGTPPVRSKPHKCSADTLERPMTRTDYYNDPDAPPANSVVPSTTAVVTDEHDRIVLIRRRANALWALPGGGMELGESIVDTAVREVKEETGLDVEVTGLIGVYSNPHHVMAYTDGEARQQFSLCFTTRLLGG